MTKLINLNDAANTQDGRIVIKYAKKTMEKFKKDIIGIEMGIAYGGCLEEIARMWGDKGKIYGYDTFEGHPQHLVKDPSPGNDRSFEAVCMNSWYDTFGREKLTEEYIGGVLNELRYYNAILVKGEVNKDSCKDLDKIHFAFLDMDIYESMDAGYQAVKDKIAKGGYLILHDAVPHDHIPRLFQWYTEEVRNDWTVVSEDEGRYLAILERA